MLPDSSYLKLSINAHKRRLSLNEKEFQQRKVSQREELKNRYQQFMQARRKSNERSPFSPQTNSVIEEDDIRQSDLSIREIRKHRNEIVQALRKAINKYNYENHEKQKKMQTLNRKKTKYQKILRIREENQREKMLFQSSRMERINEYNQQRIKLKKSVDLDKMSMGQSRLKILNEKKTLGDERRQEVSRIKLQIQKSRIKELEQNKKLRLSISLGQQQLKERKKILLNEKLNANSEYFLLRMTKQVEQVTKFQKKSTRTISNFEKKIIDLERSNQDLSQQLKNYDRLLKNGSTLRKAKPILKVKMNYKGDYEKRYKTQNEQSQIFQ